MYYDATLLMMVSSSLTPSLSLFTVHCSLFSRYHSEREVVINQMVGDVQRCMLYGDVKGYQTREVRDMGDIMKFSFKRIYVDDATFYI